MTSRLDRVARPLLGTPQRPVASSTLLCSAFLLTLLAVWADAMFLSDGHFGYSLDDPYIHLALAEQLAQHHYGINPSEVSSPSSSVLWPLLLAPLTGHAWTAWVPFLINVVCSLGSAMLIGQFIDERLAVDDPRRLYVCVCFVFIGNMAGLVFTGMEHSLQVLIAVVGALGVVRAREGKPIPSWCLAVAALGPAVRYELFAPVAALAVCLLSQRRWLAAVLLCSASAVPVVLFSLYLVHLGLGPLPNSVFAKLRLVDPNGLRLLVGLRYLPFVIMGVALAALARSRRSWPLAGAALALALHGVVGRFGWFNRYEIYAVVFGALIFLGELRGLAEKAQRWGYSLLGLCGIYYLISTFDVPVAVENIYHQQFQMHRFAADFYKKSVAVNDIGWVSFERPAQAYVLDLYGLASTEALQQRLKTADWVEGFVRRHDVGLAMIYSEWFWEIPASWTPLGTLTFAERRITPAHSDVAFFATTPAAVPELKAELERFVPTLPEGARFVAP